MFNDFHESPRNAGMVGVLLGFVVLVGFCGLGVLVFNGLNSDDTGPPLSVKVINQKGIIDDISDDIRKRTLRLEELEGFKSAGQSLKSTQEELLEMKKAILLREEKVTDMEDTIEAAELSFEEYRDQYRQRERSLAKGEVIDLSETKGEGFEACKILGISPLYLRVMQKAGPIGIPYQELPEDVQDRFQFGEEEAEIYRQRMAAAESRKDQQIADYRKKQDAMKAEDAITDLKRRINETTLEIQKNKNLATKLDGDVRVWEAKASALDQKADAARSAGRVTSNPGHARQARNKASNLKSQADNARASAQKLEVELGELEALLSEKQ